MGWLPLIGSLKSEVSFAKEPYKRDNILQKSHIKEIIFCKSQADHEEVTLQMRQADHFEEPTNRDHPIPNAHELLLNDMYYRNTMEYVTQEPCARRLVGSSNDRSLLQNIVSL